MPLNEPDKSVENQSNAEARAYRSMTPSPKTSRTSRSPGPAGRMPEMEGFPEIMPESHYGAPVETNDQVSSSTEPENSASNDSRDDVPQRIGPESDDIFIRDPQSQHVEINENATFLSGGSPRLSRRRATTVSDDTSLDTRTEGESQHIEIDENATFLSGGSPRLRRRRATTASNDSSLESGAGGVAVNERDQGAPPPYNR